MSPLQVTESLASSSALCLPPSGMFLEASTKSISTPLHPQIMSAHPRDLGCHGVNVIELTL